MWHNNIYNPPKRSYFPYLLGKLAEKVNQRPILFTSPTVHFVNETDNRAFIIGRCSVDAFIYYNAGYTSDSLILIINF